MHTEKPHNNIVICKQTILFQSQNVSQGDGSASKMLVLQAQKVEFKSKKSGFGTEARNSSTTRETETSGALVRVFNQPSHLGAPTHVSAHMCMRAHTRMCTHTSWYVHSDYYAMREMDKSRI